MDTKKKKRIISIQKITCSSFGWKGRTDRFLEINSVTKHLLIFVFYCNSDAIWVLYRTGKQVHCERKRCQSRNPRSMVSGSCG